MKTKILVAVLSIGLFSLSTMQAQEMKMDKKVMKHDSTKKEMNQDKMDHSKMAKVYECTMHPGVTYNKPGECPKCGMTLVEKKMDMKKESKEMKMDKKMDMKNMSKKKMEMKEGEGENNEHKH